MPFRSDFRDGFADGFREAGRLVRQNHLPAISLAVGGVIALYALVRLGA